MTLNEFIDTLIRIRDSYPNYNLNVQIITGWIDDKTKILKDITLDSFEISTIQNTLYIN